MLLWGCSAWRLLRPLLFCWPPRYFVIEMGSRGQRRLLVSDVLDPAPLPEGLGIPAEDWYRTPVSVRLVYCHASQALGNS